MNPEIAEQIAHMVHQIEPLKHNQRFTTNRMVKRKDTVASHSWRASVLALFVNEIIEQPINRSKVYELLAIHDLTELRKGGTQALGFRDEVKKVQEDQEDDLSSFSYLPESAYRKLQDLWSEFKAQKTLESRVAKALERLESNWTAIESVEAVRDETHRQKTIDYITGLLSIGPGLDMLIRQQLKEIEVISSNGK